MKTEKIVPTDNVRDVINGLKFILHCRETDYKLDGGEDYYMEHAIQLLKKGQ